MLISESKYIYQEAFGIDEEFDDKLFTVCKKNLITLKKKEKIVSRVIQEEKKEKDSSPNAVIRRLYKKKIKAGIKGKIPFWASPTELEIMAQWQESVSEKELHLLYEKARYSKEGCLKEELNRYNLKGKK